MRNSGSNARDIGILNRAAVLEQIATGKAVTRVDIARKTGLTHMTVCNIVNALIAQDIIVSTKKTMPVSSSPGRRSRILAISAKAPLICGMLVKRKHIVVMLGRISGEFVDSVTCDYEGLIREEKLLAFLLDGFRTLCARTENKVVAVGISCIGPIDAESGSMLNPRGFFDRDSVVGIRGLIEQSVHLPAFLMHDTSASILAEKLYGDKHDIKNFLYLALYTGIGAGLFLNNAVYTGNSGKSGEVGQMTVGERGCLEQYANLNNLINRLHDFEQIFPSHPLLKKKQPGFGDFVLYANQGDALCVILLEEYCDSVAEVIVNLVRLLDIDLVLLEYEGESYGDFLEKLLEEKVNRKIDASVYKRVCVRQSRFGENLSALGSLSIVSTQIFEGKLHICEQDPEGAPENPA